MTQETPGKIFSLLGVAMAFMAFLFFVSVSDASFSRARAVADPFGPASVLGALDNVSNVYGKAADTYLFSPLQDDLAYYQDSLNWVIDNADMAILNTLGLGQLAEAPVSAGSPALPKVAGAYTASYARSDFNVDTLFAALAIQ